MWSRKIARFFWIFLYPGCHWSKLGFGAFHSSSFGEAAMRLGILALVIIFITSGVLNIIKPEALSASKKPDGSRREEEKPSPQVLRRRRAMGVLFCVVGGLIAVYYVLLLLQGADA